MQKWASSELSEEERRALKRHLEPLFPGLYVNFNYIKEPLRSSLLSAHCRPEPEDFLRLLETHTGQIMRTFSNAKSARSFIRQFQESSQFALVATRVVFEGPFAPLRNNVRILDLPGVQDVDVYRGQVAYSALKSGCSHIWMLGAAASFTALESNFVNLHTLAEQGLLPHTTIIATKSDQLRDRRRSSHGVCQRVCACRRVCAFDVRTRSCAAVRSCCLLANSYAPWLLAGCRCLSPCM